MKLKTQKRRNGDVAVASISIETGVFDICLPEAEAMKLHAALAHALVSGQGVASIPRNCAYLAEHED